MWGIVPAAGAGSRIQPLAFSKELLPVGSRIDGDREKPKAVSEYLIERMVFAGANKICIVISPGKSDILEYYGGSISNAHMCYVVQPQPTGLCDAIFRALPLILDNEPVIIGLPDTIWFPEDALRQLDDASFSFLLFPVEHPELFDAVIMNGNDRIEQVRVKQAHAGSSWIWGAFKLPGAVLRQLYDLWCERNKQDQYIGTLVNAFISRGGIVHGIKAGQAYVDVGTVHGYREAMKLLSMNA